MAHRLSDGAASAGGGAEGGHGRGRQDQSGRSLDRGVSLEVTAGGRGFLGWISRDFRGFLGISMGWIYEFLYMSIWILVDFGGFLWISVGFYGFWWICMD